MRIVEHRPECDGHAIIVERDDGSRIRLHAQKRPEDVKAWVAAALGRLQAAEQAARSVPPEITAVERIERAKLLIGSALTTSRDAETLRRIKAALEGNDGDVGLETIR